MTGDALFDVDELAPDPARMGRVEAALHRSLAAAEASGKLLPEDAGLAAAALVAARALDQVEANANGSKTAYAVQAVLSPYRECLHALRLPTAFAPASAAPVATGPSSGTPNWLHDLAGAPE